MLAIFNKVLVNPPKELNSPASLDSSKRPKNGSEILRDFESCYNNALSMSFKDVACLAYVKPQNPYSSHKRLFCGYDEIYCIFNGNLNNLCSLIRQYGLSKSSNEAMFLIEAYRTLRDRGPYPAHQVLQELDGSFSFVIYDAKAGQIFATLGANEGKGVGLFWGVAGDGSVVISDNLEVVKGSCAKSYAPFPSGCMFHSEQGLMSFEHPMKKMKAMPRVDSEGVMCGAYFKPDFSQTIVGRMPRVGSEANWSLGGSQA